jgi:drug/metabolite transporter (DMT)-like permease
VLFFVPTAIWGTTWLVIKFQLGRVAPEALVAWRFALASALLLGFAGGVPVVPGTAVSMGYAALLLLGWCLASGIPLTFDASAPYVLSLVHLSVLESIVAFVTYLTLLQRVGAGRAGYTSAITPVVAMLASTLFEDYHWTGSAVAGLFLVLAGTVLVLRAKARVASPTSTAPPR